MLLWYSSLFFGFRLATDSVIIKLNNNKFVVAVVAAVVVSVAVVVVVVAVVGVAVAVYLVLFFPSLAPARFLQLLKSGPTPSDNKYIMLK